MFIDSSTNLVNGFKYKKVAAVTLIKKELTTKDREKVSFRLRPLDLAGALPRPQINAITTRYNISQIKNTLKSIHMHSQKKPPQSQIKIEILFNKFSQNSLVCPLKLKRFFSFHDLPVFSLPIRLGQFKKVQDIMPVPDN